MGGIVEYVLLTGKTELAKQVAKYIHSDNPKVSSWKYLLMNVACF